MVRNTVVLFVGVVAASLVLFLHFWRLLGLLQPVWHMVLWDFLPSCFFVAVVLVLLGGVCSAVWFQRLWLIVRRVLADFLGWLLYCICRSHYLRFLECFSLIYFLGWSLWHAVLLLTVDRVCLFCFGFDFIIYYFSL